MKKAPKKFGDSRFAKALVYFTVGLFTYPGFMIFNKLKISGTEHLKGLPHHGVLFVSNHQTYFADVIAMLHIFSAVKWGKENRLGFPIYLLNPYTRINYVAATKTMKSSWLAKLFTRAGAITVQRTWNASAGESRKGLDVADTRQISSALQDNWVINFPQGTTTPFAPGRKGTAFIMRTLQPIVIPLVIDGFSTAFDKKGLKLRKTGTKLRVTFKAPLRYSATDDADTLMRQVMTAIEQIPPAGSARPTSNI